MTRTTRSRPYAASMERLKISTKTWSPKALRSAISEREERARLAGGVREIRVGSAQQGGVARVR